MKFIFWTLIFLVLLHPAFALELSPTRNVIDFAPSKTVTGSFTVTNNADTDMQVVITARGDLAPSIKLFNFLDTIPGGEKKAYTYEVLMPASFDKPGLHEGEIVVTSAPPKDEESGAYLGTAVTLVTQVRVRVPYPGTYAESRLDINAGSVNETVHFILPLSNLGKNPIQSAQGTITVLGQNNVEITKVQTQTAPVPAQQTTELSSSWSSATQPGIYFARALVTYDGKMTSAERTFSVGNIFVEILSLSVKDFRLGGIAKINILAYNKWNLDLPHVYAEIVVYDELGTIVYENKNSFVSVKALEQATVPVFFDTDGLVAGKYRADITLHYEDKKTVKPFVFVLGTSTFDISSPTGNVVSERAPATKGSTVSVVFILEIAFVILNIGLFLYFRRKLSKQQ